LTCYVPYWKTFGINSESCCFRLIEYDKHVKNEMIQCCQPQEIMEFRKLIESRVYLNPLKELESREGKMEIRQDLLTGSILPVVHFRSIKAAEYSAKQPVPSDGASRGDEAFRHRLSEYFAFGLNKTPISLDKENVDVFCFPYSLARPGKGFFERMGDRSRTVLATDKCGKCQLLREDTYEEHLFVGTGGGSQLRGTWQTDC
jgi:hypothetical protein